jgi:hypothetical protein
VDRSTDTTAHNHSDRIVRTAWFCAFVLPLALAALLLGVKSAQAASPAPESAPFAFEEEFELEAEGEEDEAQLEAEFAQEECEIAKEEATEGEITAAEAKEVCTEAEEAAKEATAGSSKAAASAECPIHSASAHSSIHHNKLKLTIGYTTTTPVTATIQLRGPVRASFKRHLGKSGVLRFTRTLHKKHGRLSAHIGLPRSERAGCPSRRLVLFPG